MGIKQHVLISENTRYCLREKYENATCIQEKHDIHPQHFFFCKINFIFIHVFFYNLTSTPMPYSTQNKPEHKILTKNK